MTILVLCHTSRHTGGNQNKILPNYIPVVTYVLNDTKKKNMHFRFPCDLCLVMAKLKTASQKYHTFNTPLSALCQQNWQVPLLVLEIKLLGLIQLVKNFK